MLLADSITDNMIHTTEGEDKIYNSQTRHHQMGRSSSGGLAPAAPASCPLMLQVHRPLPRSRLFGLREFVTIAAPPRGPAAAPRASKPVTLPCSGLHRRLLPFGGGRRRPKNGQSRPSPGEPDRRSTRSAHGDPRDPAILSNSGASTTLHAFFGPGRNVTLRRDPGGGGGGGLGPLGPGGGGPAGGAAPLPRPR